MGRFIRKGDRKKDVKPLTREQATAFLAGVQEHYPDYYPFFLCAFRTGLRFGELLGLKWGDVNVAGNFVEVQRSFSHGHMDTPKSKKSRRVDLSNQLKLVLLQHRGAVQRRIKGALPEPVFPDSQGGHLNGDNVRNRVFYPLLEKLDLPSFRIHDIRHSFASQLLANGAPVVYVKEQMGHASIQTTVDIYGHLIQGANRNEVNRLDDANYGGAVPLEKAGYPVVNDGNREGLSAAIDGFVRSKTLAVYVNKHLPRLREIRNRLLLESFSSFDAFFHGLQWKGTVIRLADRIPFFSKREREQRAQEEAIFEGRMRETRRKSPERDRRVRDLALERGHTCEVCGFSFEDVYGKKFAEVHHLRRLSRGGSRRVDPAKDLLVVCSNCHTMLHPSPHEVRDWRELRRTVEQRRRRANKR